MNQESFAKTVLFNPIIKRKDNDLKKEVIHSKCVPTPFQQSEIHKKFPTIEVPDQIVSDIKHGIHSEHRWIIFQGRYREHKFPMQTILPKVQLNRIVPRRQLPRDVQVDRKRREFAKYNLEEELLKENITTEDLYPTKEQYYMMSSFAFDKHFLPIAFFDDTKLDCHSPKSWLNLGATETLTFYVPVMAFLPKDNGLLNCQWEYAAAMSFDEENNLWKVLSLYEEEVFEVSRLQIMFLAEDPRDYVLRVKHAVLKRNKAEAIVEMEAILDCLMLHSLETEKFLRQPSIDELIQSMSCNEEFRASIELEVYLLFEHLMAFFAFENFVKKYPKEFPRLRYIERSDMHPKKLPPNRKCREDRAYLKKLKLDTKATVFQLLQSTLYYNKAGIESMAHGHEEGSYIEQLNLFIVNLAKPLSIPEFIQVQNQNGTHVTSYLKTFWPSKIASGIILILRQLGRGWLDISISDWSVYSLCKISRFVFQVKLRMQESMQVFLENSIISFIKFVTDPCKQFLSLTPAFTWTNDFSTTHFPWEKPIFLLTIGVNEDEEVYYSTKPDDFVPILCNLFKSTLERTNGVRCIDSEMMSGLRFAPNLYVLTVELIESLYIKKNAFLQQCYKQALIPLYAYAKLFERFIPFCMVDVHAFMHQYRESKKSSADVKADILEHKRQHRELKELLPESITIGPFLILVETIKMYMIRKHKEIIRYIFEYYIDRMHEINGEILQRCDAMYNKIDERPYSIEHLFEIREYASNLPVMLQELRDDITVMCREYDLLDPFFYSLSDTQFAMKWDAVAGPQRILQRCATLFDEQKIDIEDFKRQHAVECASFEEHLQSVNDEVQQFSLIFEAPKVAEISVDVKKLWTIIQKLQEDATVLSSRQKLLELEELSTDFLQNIIEAFTPYRNLWIAGSDFLKLEDATVGNPMSNIDFEETDKALADLRLTLQNCYVVFREQPDIQEVAKAFLRNIDRFQPLYMAIKHLTTENWLSPHWEELKTRSGMDFKWSTHMSFQQLVRKGIMQHLDLVREISIRADTEADEVRRAMEAEARRLKEEEERILLRKQMRKCRRDIL